MAAGNVWFIGAVVICVILISIIIWTYSSLLNTDSDQSDNLLAVVIGTVMATSIVVYAVSAWLFKGNPNVMIHFLLFTMLIIIMPMSVIGATVSTAQLNGLRNMVALNTGSN